MADLPTKPGYYWAKLVTPSYGFHTEEDWQSPDWELVQVNDNNGEGDEALSVSVFGIPVVQWPRDFLWGPMVESEKPL